MMNRSSCQRTNRNIRPSTPKTKCLVRIRLLRTGTADVLAIACSCGRFADGERWREYSTELSKGAGGWSAPPMQHGVPCFSRVLREVGLCYLTALAQAFLLPTVRLRSGQALWQGTRKMGQPLHC